MAFSSRSTSDGLRHEVASQLIARIGGGHVVEIPSSAFNASSLLILSCRDDGLETAHGGVIGDR